MGNCCAISNRSISNPVSVSSTSSPHQPPQVTHSDRPIPRSLAETPAESPLTSSTSPAPSEPSTTSPPPRPSLLQSSPPPTCLVPNVRVVTNLAFNVPSAEDAIFDFLPNSNSPENMTYRHLLSDDVTKKSIALYGMSGVGKTTILCALGRKNEIRSKFKDGVWFFQLGHDVTMPSFIRQLQRLVKSTLPDFLEDFKELAASEDSHREMITDLTNRLAQKRLLLLFDDVWDINSRVYQLVCATCKHVRGNESTWMKVLSSTRYGDVADILTRDSCIQVNAYLSESDKNLRIFCLNACLKPCDIPSLSFDNRNALDHILRTCGGLPLTLSVAGSAVKQLMIPGSNRCDHNAISEFWGRLQRNTRRLARAEVGDGHSGLAYALKTSLEFVEEKWESEKETDELEDELRAGEMFESLCIMQKQMCLPVSAIKKLWGVREVEAGVRILSRNSLASELRDGNGIGGVGVHDLVLDMSMETARSGGGAAKWHARLLDGYRESLNRSGGADDGGEDEGVEWWKLDSSDKYIVDNVVRHLLGAGDATETLGLLTDYRWVERMNQDKDRAPFQKVIAELRLLQSYTVEHEKKTMAKNVARDIEVIVKAMGLCMVPHCMKNRDECTFQLFGRLRDMKSGSGIVERLVSSIERYGRVPWARAGPGVLTSGGSMLKRVLDVEEQGECMCLLGGGEEVVVGGWNGKVGVYNRRNGSKKMSLVGLEEGWVVDVYYECSSSRIYSCSSRGRVVVWEEYKMCYCVQAEGLQEDEKIECMQVLPKRGRVVLGTSEGRLFVMDMEDGGIIAQNPLQTVDAHDSNVRSLTAGRSEDVVVSGSEDGRIRVWDAENFADTENELERHERAVYSVALSGDGRLLAFASDDRTVRVFDLERREQLWSSSTAHRSYVSCVLLSEDASLLYSADWDGTIHVWKLSSDGQYVSLLHTLHHSTMQFIGLLCIGDESELFALNENRIHVWDARDAEDRDDQVVTFLPDVDRFALSADEATLLTRNWRSECLEIRDVCDVSECIDRVVSSVDTSKHHVHWPLKFIVSNDRKYVAFAKSWPASVVYIYDASEGVFLRTLSDVKQLVLASISNQRGNSPSDEGRGNSNGSASDEPRVQIDSLRFSADGSTISVVPKVRVRGEDGEWTWMKSKRICWNVCSRAVLDESQVDGETNASNRSTSSVTNRGEQSSALRYDSHGKVRCEHDGKCFTIATLEEGVKYWLYSQTNSRLWFASWSGGLFHIDLMTDNNQLQLYDNRPPLPPLPQLHPPLSEDHAKHKDQDKESEAEEVYDVFVSHAGPDKWTIAKPLYDLLVKLGYKVFLDKWELEAGQHAPQKMIHAMRTAKIAVVILSPEFAARKWTIKELMCFLDRSAAGGERGVIIIPVFYRLSLDECKDQKLLAGLKNDAGENALAADGFLERIGKEGHYRMEEIMGALQAVTLLTGIENNGGVTNGDSAEEVAERKEFVESIGDAVEKANRRLESGRAAGPSGS